MRTRVTFDGERAVPHTIEKTIVDSIVLKTHLIDVRISLAREKPVKMPPPIVDTHHMRIKQKRTFELRQSPFVIECGMVWSGVDKTSAEARQSNTEPVFEVECEVMHDTLDAWSVRHKHNNSRMARSFLYKISDMMLSTGIAFVAVD